jgi:DNA-binding transcriptional MerR regulator
MMRIGEFARLTRVSVKTLQYYDELALIKPARVDEFTGYRYYAHEQYGRLNRILALKDLGFSLEHIRQLVDGGLSTELVQAMLAQQASEIRQRLQEDQGKLARLEAWLTEMKKEDAMSEYEVVIKRVPAITVASLRGVVPSPPDQDRLWGELMSDLSDRRTLTAEPFITLYHDDEPKEQDWDIEVCAPVSGPIEAGEGVTVRELTAVETMASVVHKGSFMTIGNAYGALTAWATEHGYRLLSPAREVLIHVGQSESQAARQVLADTVVEVQFAVEKT